MFSLTSLVEKLCSLTLKWTWRIGRRVLKVFLRAGTADLLNYCLRLNLPPLIYVAKSPIIRNDYGEVFPFVRP